VLDNRGAQRPTPERYPADRSTCDHIENSTPDQRDIEQARPIRSADIGWSARRMTTRYRMVSTGDCPTDFAGYVAWAKAQVVAILCGRDGRHQLQAGRLPDSRNQPRSAARVVAVTIAESVLECTFFNPDSSQHRRQCPRERERQPRPCAKRQSDTEKRDS
jgi:hypothetical protein